MRLGIFAKTFPQQGASKVLAAVRAAGYEAAQFNLSCVGIASLPDRLEPATTRAIFTASQQHKVAIAAISGTYNMAHPDKNIRNQGRERLALIIRQARTMGSNLVTLCTGSRDPDNQWHFHPDNTSSQAWRDSLSELEAALQVAESEDVTLAMEPEPANIIATPELALKALTELQSTKLKVILDPANLLEGHTREQSRACNSRALDLLAGHIALAHAKDQSAEGRVVAAGQGIIDFEHFIQGLMSAGFQGDLITHGLQAHEAREVATFLGKYLPS